MKKIYAALLTISVLILTNTRSLSQISLTGATYTQDFNTLASAGTALNTTLPAGWLMSEAGTANNTIYTAGTGSSGTGDTYSFGAAANIERALGGLQSGTLIPTNGASFTNNTGSTVTTLTVSYTGEQWRMGTAGRVDRLDFQYSLDATSLTTGVWVDANSLDFTAPVTAGAVGALDGNAAANRTAISFTITGLTIANGATFFIRWTDLNATGADDGLSVDDFSISTGGAVTTNVDVSAGTDAAEPATNGTFNITLSSPAPVGGVTVTYSLSGTAILNTDYTDPQTGSITIAQGNTSAIVTLNVTDDPAPETPETIIITLTGATSPFTITTPSATINLTSDDIGPISLTGAIYSQDFNTLINTGTGSLFSLPTGWAFLESLANANTIYTAGTGSGNGGDTYSFGAAAISERAFGGLQSGSLLPTVGALFINNTGAVINSFRIIYTGEQWRLGATGRNDKMDFQYSLDATNLGTGTWTDVNQLDFTAPISTGAAGALDGNASANRITINFAVTGLSIPNGSTFLIRWNDLNATGADDGLGVDDFSIETNPADPNPPVITSLSPVNGATNIATNLTATITFDENIQKGTGNIIVKRTLDNTVFLTIDITTPAVTVSGNTASFNLSGLAASTGYYIEIDNGAIKDLVNNNFAGISGNSTWAFTTGTLLYSASFNICSSSPTEGFTQYSVIGPQFWACTIFGIDPAHSPTGSAANGLQINGFNVTNIPNEDWLISPSFDLTSTTYPLLSFWSRTKFNGLPLQLRISTDYVSGDPTLATWTDLNGKFPAQTTDVWTLSSNINLAAFKTANVHFAFVYFSSDDDGARWTLDDIQLDNSATPPPPSLTVSTTDIQFGYAAAGNNVDKTFTVTGNDITGDITLTATSNFSLSTDGITFSSLITLLQASANNIPTTVYARFSPTLNNQNYTGTVTVSTAGVPDFTVTLKGTSFDPVNTLEVVNWNMEWFGSTTFGPTNDAQQQANAQTILQNIGADIYGLVEVVDESRLATIVSNMPGYAYVICNYGSHTNTNESGPTPLSEAQKEAFVYKTSIFSNVTTAPLLSQGINSAADLTNPAYNYFASGRFPYMMTADVTLNGVTQNIRFVLIHAKANTSPTIPSYNRRKSGSDTLHLTLNNLYPNDKIVFLGDINDDLDSTITDGINPKITSYSAFTGDVANFYPPTLALSLAGKKSTVSYNDVIDHVILSTEMQCVYMSGTANILTDVANLVSNYGSSTSDHYPVFTRYSFDLAPNASINYAGTPYCSNAGTASVTRTGTAGGTYSSTAGLSINVSTGDINLGTSTAGTYTVTYTIPASGGCSQFTTTTSVTITAMPAATISYTASPYCQNAGTASVTQTGTAGGTYSSTAGLSINASTGAVTLGTSTPGTYTVTYTVAAAAGCPVFTTTTSITINLPPAITCPANITVSNTPGQCGAVVTYPPATATGTLPVVITYSQLSGSFFPKGTTTVTATATNICGTATCSFAVTVNDTEVPTITCPANITVGNTPGLCSAVVTYPLPIASDNCCLPGSVSITQTASQTPTAGSVACNAGGFHTNNSYWRAYNLSSICLSGPLTVNSVQFGIELADANGTGTTQPITVRVYTSAGAFPGGVRTLIATEVVNVPDQTLSLYNVVLTTPPTVPANSILVLEVFSPDGRAPANNRFFMGSNTSAQTGPSYISAADCGIATPTDLAAIGFPNMHIILNANGTTSGPSPITQIAGLPSGSVFPVGTTTNTYQATDASGNTATCSFTVRVNDTQAPTIVCPANIIATTPIGSCTAIVNYTVTATDNCPGVTVARTAGPASGSAFPLGVTTITHVATDAAGNTSTCSFTVTVNDGQLPVISAQPTNKTGCLNDNVVFSVTSSNAVSYQWQQWNGTAWVNITGATGATLTLNSVTISMNTNSYRVMVIGLCTTVTSGFATLYVNLLPTIDLVPSQSPILIPGQSMNLTAVVSPAGGSIRWFKNGVQISATSLTLSGLTVDDIGTYRAIYTDPNGCVKTSADMTITGQSTDKLWIYPNPTSGQFQVRFFNQANEPITLNIYDSKGARVYQKKVTTTIPYTRIDVDLSKNQSGTFLVEIRNGAGVLVGARRIVVAH